MKRFKRRARLCIACLALSTTTSAEAQKLVTPGYLFNSDPTCREIGGRFYLFTTQDPFTAQFQRDNTFFRGMYAYHALSTSDFDQWVDHGSILTGRDVTWNAGGALWDGDAGIPYRGRYYAYAPFRVNAKGEQNYGRFQLGAFVADRLDGPYRDVFGAPMKGVDGKPVEALSPYVVNGDDGSPYLLWGSGDTEKHEVWMARLNPDMTSLAQKPRRLSVPGRDACGNLEYFESPMLLKTGGRWVLTYVAYKDAKGPGCDAKGSYVRYTSAAGMFGPFDREAPRTLIYPSPGGQESTQQGMCTYRGESYLAYHVPYDDVTPYADHHRQVAVTRLRILPGGSFAPVHPETDEGVGTPGVARLTLDAFGSRREAAEFHARTGATGEAGLAGEFQMKMKPGGYLIFRSMDFGDGAGAFRAEVSAETPTIRSAILEVRLENAAGPVVATVVVSPTGGRTRYAVRDVPLRRPVSGLHDLALVARGTGGDAEGHLFNITWFSFARAGTRAPR
ncbi:family 43 glycosylhydrolase [Sphingomonas sp. Tas61C01]|uniref:family 43 glycosylhydrolase n=1 Tax=Sphingomonas sp. Tas61C01 TaxID=3458297 RepID=UPI00403E9023